LHYVNVDTVKTGGRDRLTLRAFDNKQGPNGDEESLTTTDQPICGMAASRELARCLAKSSPKRYIPCGFDFLTTARAILAVLRSSQVETPTKNRGIWFSLGETYSVSEQQTGSP
jgi:hypothetical protein